MRCHNFCSISWRGKRMHGVDNGFYNIMPTSRCISTSLTTFLSLHLYLCLIQQNHACIHYWSHHFSFSSWVQRWIHPNCTDLNKVRLLPTIQRTPSPSTRPCLAWKKRRSNNSISCNDSSSKNKSIAGGLPGNLFKRNVHNVRIFAVKSLYNIWIIHGISSPIRLLAGNPIPKSAVCRHLQGGMTGAQQQLLSLWHPLTTCVDGQH